MFLQDISSQELVEKLQLHQLWLYYDRSGRCADFSHMNLKNTNFRGMDLRHIKFRGSDLRYADLRETDLRITDFSGADLRGAICDLSILYSFSLRETMWLYSDIPWWMGHSHQCEIILCDQ